MNILHILEDYSIYSGGIRTVVKELIERLNSLEHKSYIISSNKEKGDNIRIVDCKDDFLLYSKDWQKKIEEIYVDEKIDIFHIHGVWRYPQYIAAKIALKNKIPYVLTPHGMYEPWIWQKGKIQKKLYFQILAKRVFSKSSKIHAITNDEKLHLAKIFKGADFVEIPNLIDHNLNKGINRITDSEKYVLYVGRLDKKKGIDILINAFSKLNPEGVKLKIAGPFNDYKHILDKLVEKNNVSDKVEFLGLVKGSEKVELFTNAFAFVAPSHSEVVGMVNLEAAVYKTPVITTYQTGLNRLWGKNGGILINPSEKELYEALNKILQWSIEERNYNGEKLYNFVLEHYSWEKRLSDWDKLYNNIS
ncbi:glycosyltransferase [Flavivirga abyssicola]|uniref:glycosyltransferase n=1 Tax=Flavivirga abyssicola TaxID=3063533 RepID=UPI0026DF1C43|nr:glycosyltransferase [Flavivirga sp. MEBiC07777]WVK14790.1 glycosyltransferase [Flavivirga sp. MEBiC07777]